MILVCVSMWLEPEEGEVRYTRTVEALALLGHTRELGPTTMALSLKRAYVCWSRFVLPSIHSLRQPPFVRYDTWRTCRVCALVRVLMGRRGRGGRSTNTTTRDCSAKRGIRDSRMYARRTFTRSPTHTRAQTHTYTHKREDPGSLVLPFRCTPRLPTTSPGERPTTAHRNTNERVAGGRAEETRVSRW